LDESAELAALLLGIEVHAPVPPGMVDRDDHPGVLVVDLAELLEDPEVLQVIERKPSHGMPTA
jgi:hypothetical protein